MGYGITSTSQIIDVATIEAGCNAYKQALSDFDDCGSEVVQAGETCTKKALSVDDQTLQYPITDLGNAIKDLKGEYEGYADAVAAEARRIYNAQVAEYNEYQRQLQQQQKQNP